MGFLDRLLGRPEPEQSGQSVGPRQTDDEIAVERYRYLLRTAPPETIEEVHAEAFSKLTDQQRDILFTQLTENALEGERPADARPATLARSATRAELRQPGTLDRACAGRGGGGQGLGFGGVVGASMLGTVAGFVVGSALVSTFLPDPGAADASADAGADGSGDVGGDSTHFGDLGGSNDSFGGDFGGDFGF
jgi:hypothetical protein